MDVNEERLQIVKLIQKIFRNIINNSEIDTYRSIHLKAIKKKLKNHISYNLFVNVMLNAGFNLSHNGSRLIFHKYKLNELKMDYKLLISNNVLPSYWFTDNDRKLHQLLNMRFSTDISSMGLKICDGKIDNAIQYILTQNTQQQNYCSINCCQYLYDLHNILTQCSNNSNNEANSFFMVSVLNHFHHILFSHHSDSDFKFIYDKFGACNMFHCEFMRRNYRARDNECKLENNVYSTLFQQIIDKIHCYIMHSYDLGHRVTPVTGQQSHKISRQRANISDCNKYNQLARYNFGQAFYYWEYYENNTHPDLLNKGYTYNDWYIPAKYTSLKEELTNNPICNLDISAWGNEYDKVCLHIKTQYCKENYIAKASADYRRPVHNTKYYGIPDDTPITEQHLIAIIVYCGYTDLSYRFSETFRKITSKESIKKGTNVAKSDVAIVAMWERLAESDISLKMRHSNFHHMAKCLIEATNLFSSKAIDGNIKVFYHGINKEMMLDSIGQYMYQPFSTTHQQCVAAHFSNHTGLILEIKCPEVVRYFNCWWISDFASESELLFIHSSKRLLFT
eukprot:512585_1